jgi:hypothetical protein
MGSDTSTDTGDGANGCAVVVRVPTPGLIFDRRQQLMAPDIGRPVLSIPFQLSKEPILVRRGQQVSQH